MFTARLLTPSNPAFGGTSVADVPSVPLSDPGPTASGGVSLLPDQHLDQGKYLVTITAQFFDFNRDGVGTAYGVIKSFLDGQPGGTTWSSAIPVSDSNNPGQSSAASIVDIPSGGGTISTRAVVRGGSNTYQGGALATILKVG